MHIRRPKSAVLCTRCAKVLPLLIDVSPVLKPGDAYTEWWDRTYGSVRTVQGLTPTTCELCQVLYNFFTRVSGFDSASTEIRITNREIAQHKGFEHDACCFRACGAELALAPLFPVVTDDNSEPVQAFTGRVVAQLMVPLLVKDWVARCDKHTACSPEHSTVEFEFSFRLIDVQEGCLVDAPRGARYVALSYVWGGVKQVMLNKVTRPFLEQPGSLTPDGLKEPEGEFAYVGDAVRAEGRTIPRTIRDAIRLCQFIGERYLWTDSLCIMQDDEFQTANGAWSNSDKMAQIPKMDIIYGASSLTVISACGVDSNAGLAGVHFSQSRLTQTIAKIGDQIFVSLRDDPLDPFWRSTWCQRAWTFQEFLLSKRHLIFLPDQVVYHCASAAYSEDRALEYVDDLERLPVWTKSWRLRPLQLPDRSRWAEDFFFPKLMINDYYNSWLKNFLQRRLTVTSDIQFAFDGALSASRRHLGDFHHGLPLTYFCEALHWLIGQSSMYYGTDPHQGLTQRREGFPSWSWTGWMWNVAAYEEFHINYAGKPDQWCRVAIWGTRTSATAGELELWQITSPDLKRWTEMEFAPNSVFEVDDAFLTNELPAHLEKLKISPYPMNCLLMKTLSSFIFVSPQWTSSHTNSLQTFSSPDLAMKNRIGEIKLGKKWQEKMQDVLEMQVILLANFFYGPNVKSKFPDQTDEHNPHIGCLVVESVGKGVFERVTTFVSRADKMKTLKWTPIVAVVR